MDLGPLAKAVTQRFAPRGLPVAHCLQDLASTMSQHTLTALTAPPGSGKTLLCPLFLYETGRFSRVSVLEPRRVTARLPAMALREVCGELVGYRIRLESLWSREQTKLGYLTYGMALRRFLNRPPDSGEVVIFDEFHERSWEAELLLAYLRSLPSGPRILLMSATLDRESLPEEVPILQSDGRLHPVTVSWETIDPQILGRRDQLANLVAQRSSEMASKHRGEQLIFLPGLGDIRAVEERLRADHLSGDIDILHSSLKESEIRRVVERPKEAGFRRILSTDIAESSVTLPGITVVIDSGLVRRPRRDELGLGNTLKTVRAPVSALDQRTGRAGRLGPGFCHRLFTRDNQMHRENFPHPEIDQADYRTVALFLASVDRLQKSPTLRWLHPPEASRLEAAISWCREHHLLTDSQNLSDKGRAVLGLPLAPRLAEFAISARWAGHSVKDVASWCQALEDSPPEKAHALTDWAAQRRARRKDNPKLAKLLERELQNHQQREARSLDEVLLESYSDTLASLAKDRAVCANPDQAALHFDGEEAPEKSLALLLGSRPRGGKGPRSAVALYHRVSRELVWESHFEELQEQTEFIYNPSDRSVRERQWISLGQLTLEEKSRPASPGPEVAKVLRRHLTSADLGDKFQNFSRRLGLFLQHNELETTIPSLEVLLESYLESRNRWDKSAPQEMLAHIKGLLPYELSIQLDKSLPEWAHFPRRRKPVRIHYPQDNSPYVKSKLQDFFAWEHPLLMNGKVELVCHLLAPNGRACQITTDLPSFWTGSYQQVRKDLRGRYPKHDWPEDPSSLS